MFKKTLSTFRRNSNEVILRTSVFRTHFTAHAENSFVLIENDCEGVGNLCKKLKFPKVWLRDNCQCEECFHKDSQSRKIDWQKFRVNVEVKHLKVDLKSLKIKWDDDHESKYDIEWLKERDFSEENRKKYLDTFYKPPTVNWGKNDFKNIYQEFHFKDVMEKDEVLRSWLECLAIKGVAMIKDSPIEKETARKLADRVAFIRKTHYGEEFIVQAKPDTKNYAYLSAPLPLHTDLPYYEYKPGVNILHCLVQSHSAGGSNLLADGFYVADRLQKENKEYFNTLTETLVDWNDIGQEDDGKPFHSIFRSPVICLDKENKYTRINHSIPQRDSHFSVHIDQVIPWYEAYATFVKILHEEAVSFKTSPGDILTFSNVRVIHGRTGYDDKEDNIRYIVGAYLDWDMIYAKLRTMYK